MAKIKINKINDSEIEVILDNDIPLAMVESLNKSLEERGLVQDDSRSSLGKRYFVRPSHRDVDDVYEKLTKSLEGMIKADEQTKLAWEQKRQSRLVDRNTRRASAGMKPISMEQFKNPTGAKSPAEITPPAVHPVAGVAPAAATPTASPKSNTLPGVVNTLHSPNLSGKVNYTKKNEDDHIENDPKCSCMKCSSMRKNNLNKSLHDKLKGGNSWGQHLPFPSADQPGSNKPLPTAEDIMANQLANMMMGKNMMKPVAGVPLLGSVVQAQPTNEQMFGHLVPTEEMLKSADENWHNRINNWMQEASKPISARFKSEEEELAYWRSIGTNPSAGSVD